MSLSLNLRSLLFICLLLSVNNTSIASTKYQEPSLNNPAQEKTANRKLKKLRDNVGKKPNFLVFVVDDMGWGDPGAYGGGESIGAATPNIDKLAYEGLKLTSTYSQPSCTPTRATLLTGRLPIRHGLLRPPQIGEKGGLDSEITIASMLSKAGYHTAISGKWHLGEEPKNQPQYNGFDEYYGFLGSTKNYTEWRDPRINPPLAADQAVVDKISSNENFIKHLIKAKRNQPHEEVYELDIPAIANVDLDTMENTINVIERMQHGEKPWFIYHAFGKVHNDNYPSDKFKASSAAKGTYQDAVTEVDYIVGRIINALKETGQAENTLVFFTSDNGPAESAWPDSGHTPFRGAKGSTWEGGVRVPGIAWWPNMIPAGGVSDGLFDLADLFTTFARLGGADLPNDRYIDGVDQTSFLLNENGSSNRKAIYYYLLNKFAAVRIGPFKQHRYIATPPVPEGISGYVNGSVLQKTSGLYVNNLYLDPKERKPIGLRTAIITKQLQTTQKQHKDTFKDFPPKVLLSLE